ncbi:MAG: hypothetical protein KDK07_22810 [Bauldia sp.]|nr:hypothetical protein [Bauldia sp.]
MLTRSEFDAARRIQRNHIGLGFELSMLRFELALKANFNPSQPRIPAGNPTGGRWTRVGVSGAQGEAPSPSSPPSGGPVSSANGPDADGWTIVGRRTDGVVREETVVHRDGSAIRAEVSAAPLTTGWNERYTVIGTDGAILTFQNRGLRQQVFDSNAGLVAESAWTGQGAIAEPIVQPVFALPALITASAELGLTLFTWLSTRNTPDRKAIIAFSAREYRPGAAPSLALDYVGALDREDVEEACPRLGEVQARTDDAVETVRRRGAVDLSPTQFGTAVHVALKRQIDQLAEASFRAEVSVLKTINEAYGLKDSIRVDVLEDVRNGTVCVYDIKTGKRGLGFNRAVEVARKVADAFGSAHRLIIIEIRPTNP